MASLKDIRKRIASVKSTQKITRAMKLVAAARLRKAQQNIVELRPYALKTLEVLSAVSARCGEDQEVHPLLAKREVRRAMFVVLTSDRGLAGAFNANVNKRAHQEWRSLEGSAEVCFGVVGRKGREYLRRRNADIRQEFTDVLENLSIEKAREVSRYIVDEYSREGLDACYLVYNQFKSAISQEVIVEQLLPIAPMEMEEDRLGDFIYEPDKEQLLDRLLPMYVEVEIYRALLESVASEHGARMTAMDAATSNAGDMIGKLTLQFNRARQAAITKELVEIIGGAEALSG
ncbi:MAG: ATP synthase F1 subunit gamma [Myxococcota bacterium]